MTSGANSDEQLAIRARDLSVLKVESFEEYQLAGFYQQCNFVEESRAEFNGRPYYVFVKKVPLIS